MSQEALPAEARRSSRERDREQVSLLSEGISNPSLNVALLACPLLEGDIQHTLCLRSETLYHINEIIRRARAGLTRFHPCSSRNVETFDEHKLLWCGGILPAMEDRRNGRSSCKWLINASDLHLSTFICVHIVQNFHALDAKSGGRLPTPPENGAPGELYRDDREITQAEYKRSSDRSVLSRDLRTCVLMGIKCDIIGQTRTRSPHENS
ncbi:hypothetical protein DFS33DRAFT_848879 [Desarmillaria ectypa]|nr:hypothetical protein DFS33DRAFT_848879 [Desarmillaria ectypa]